MKCWGVTLRWTVFPCGGGGGEGGVVILLIAPCYGNQDKLWLHEPLGASTDYYTLANGVTSERYNDCDCRS